MPRRPVILSASSAAPVGRAGAIRVGLNDAYVRALLSVGLVPLIVPPSLSANDAQTAVAGAAGLVLSGGEDIDPARYGAARHPLSQPAHPGRDATELALVQAARAAGCPTLAICRGLQLLNVALGGTLVQDIAAERPASLVHPRDDARQTRVHDIAVVPGSRLSAATQDVTIAVNSLHHQAVDRLAPVLRATAHASDGIIEAAETADAWWVLAVQWHPEELIDDPHPWDRAIFTAFAEACNRGN